MLESHTIVCFDDALINFLAGTPVPDEVRTLHQFAGGLPAKAPVAVTSRADAVSSSACSARNC